MLESINTHSRSLWSVYLLGLIINLSGLHAGEVEEILAKEDRARVPEFPQDLAWINTKDGKPLSIEDLKGKVVLLDFWTYGCINCMHVIPDLKKLERKYEKELVVIGVHSAKFDTEKGLENIRNAALRYGLIHPVLNDNHQDVWKAYGIHSWPTLVVLDPTGRPVGAVSGEGNYDVLDDVIGKVIKHFDPKKGIDREKVIGQPEKILGTNLLYPTKVAAQPAGDGHPARIFISDTNRHRILVATPEGQVTDIIGNGTHGNKDGSYTEAKFDMPRGLVAYQNSLFIADTENNSIRKVDLEKKTVETIAGTGEQKWSRKGGLAVNTPLNSPWDVEISPDGKSLYIAMAGNHAIWLMNLENKTVDLFAGTPKEALVDGEFLEAAFAQPSGLALSGDKLYSADAESSSVRELNLKTGKVSTLVGTGLFDFADQDGPGKEALLQHVLAVRVYGEKLLIADTYNHKIKQIDLTNHNKVETFLGTGQPGKDDGEKPSFYEPSGLAILNDTLFIADTNNHLIRVVDLKTKKVSTLKLDMPK